MVVITKEQIQKATNENIWNFGNKILYDMCESKPFHKDTDAIVGKIWLIGRSYSAAVERRKKYNGEDNFYELYLVPAIKGIGDELDAAITRLKTEEEITDAILPEILKLHKLLCDTLYEITDLQKRSFASKYLHFHLPKLFYIYDSIANTNIRKYSMTKINTSKNKLGGSEFDADYAAFYLKAHELRSKIYEAHQVYLSPRELDNILLWI